MIPVRAKNVAGWASLVSRQAHNLIIVGSNPAPAPTFETFHDGSDYSQKTIADCRLVPKSGLARQRQAEGWLRSTPTKYRVLGIFPGAQPTSAAMGCSPMHLPLYSRFFTSDHSRTFSGFTFPGALRRGFFIVRGYIKRPQVTA